MVLSKSSRELTFSVDNPTLLCLKRFKFTDIKIIFCFELVCFSFFQFSFYYNSRAFKHHLSSRMNGIIATSGRKAVKRKKILN